MAHQTTRPGETTPPTVQPPVAEPPEAHILGTGRIILRPTDVANLALWYRPESLIEDGLNDEDRIGTWRDESGSGQNVTQAVAASKPIFNVNRLNGHPIVGFDGTRSLTRSSGIDFGDAYTAFTVAEYSSGADAQQAIFDLSVGATNTGFALFCDAGTDIWRCVDSVGSKNVSPSGDQRDGVYRLRTGICRGASGIEYYRNAATQGTSTYVPPNPNTLNSIALGALHLGTLYLMTGSIAEVIIYARDLNDEERRGIESYLMAKYALTAA